MAAERLAAEERAKDQLCQERHAGARGLDITRCTLLRQAPWCGLLLGRRTSHLLLCLQELNLLVQQSAHAQLEKLECVTPALRRMSCMSCACTWVQ